VARRCPCGATRSASEWGRRRADPRNGRRRDRGTAAAPVISVSSQGSTNGSCHTQPRPRQEVGRRSTPVHSSNAQEHGGARRAIFRRPLGC
jgi:hypothetical protein